MHAQFIYCSLEMSVTANNRRSGGQRFHGILFGRFNGRSAVQWDLVFPVDVYIQIG